MNMAIHNIDDADRVEQAKEERINKYGVIKLNFGKYKGTTLSELVDKQPDYLLWLLQSMEKDKKDKTPTMKAIMAYIKYKLD
jgi:uncharacterized protein (DUF3820 family)